MKITETFIRQIVRQELTKVLQEAYIPTEEEKEQIHSSSYENIRNTDVYKKMTAENPHGTEMQARIAAHKAEKAAKKRKNKKV